MIDAAIYLELASRFSAYDTATQRPDLLVLTILSAIASNSGKSYCYPSQDKILDLLSRYGRHMSRRTLNRHLNALVGQGWIKRQRRHQHCATRGFTFRSSLYTLTRRSYRWLSGLGNAAKKALSWGRDFKCRSRVPYLAQNNPSRDINTGGALKSGAPPDPKGYVARDARTEGKEKSPNLDGPGYQSWKAALQKLHGGNR